MSLVAVNWNPSRSFLRQFGCAAGLLVLGWGLALYLRRGWSAGEGVLAAAGFALLLGSATCPRALFYPYLGLTLVTAPVGWVVGQVFLAVMFYGVFTPLALVFRLVGRDALGECLDPQAVTYWTARPAARDPRQYLRQF
jgi:hypothetical protein